MCVNHTLTHFTNGWKRVHKKSTPFGIISIHSQEERKEDICTKRKGGDDVHGVRRRKKECISLFVNGGTRLTTPANVALPEPVHSMIHALRSLPFRGYDLLYSCA